MMLGRRKIRYLLRRITNVHTPTGKPSIFIFSTPRSGSTWMLEILTAEKGMKPCNEPLNIRNATISNKLDIDQWSELASESALPKIRAYFQSFINGTYTFKNLRPFQNGYDFFTNRITFKILFGLEDRLQWLKDNFDAQIIYLVRHPIPVALSREGFPRLPTLLRSSNSLSMEQLELAEAINRRGSKLERGVLDWCLQNRMLMRSLGHVDLMVTYEQLVTDPAVVFERLVRQFALRSAGLIKQAIPRLSSSIAKSTADSIKILESRHSERDLLITKWKKRISAQEETTLMRIPAFLDIDIYQSGNPLPNAKYLLHNGPSEIGQRDGA